MRFVVMPGLDGTGRLQKAFCEALRAFGEVDPVVYPSSVVTYAQAVAYLRPLLPDGPFVMIAESYSGPVAAMLAADRPHGLCGVVYLASFARRPRVVPAWMALALRAAPVRSRLSLALARPVLIGRWGGPGFVAHLKDVLQDLPQRVSAGRMKAVLSVDVREALKRIEVPQVYVQARGDMLVPRRAARDFEAAGCEIVVVDGPHFLAEANPDGVAEVLRQRWSGSRP